ncbi:MAG: L-glutamate gamma-semialdehyde dehydrogenase [bacterium]|nr:L-glutamate gamma-semialdehyde dehydrogenase [bacterium]
MLPEFKNETFVDFSIPANHEKMGAALNNVKKEFGKEYPLIIGGKKELCKDKFNSYNPSNKKEVIGVIQQPTVEKAIEAIEIAHKTFNEWKEKTAEERAGYLFKAAAIMRRRRFELSAVLVYETGKSWPEADGDLAEAIDFLEFYGREALRYGAPQEITPYPGELNESKYIPLGVGVVIPPWNFPMAILTGMTSAAFVAGNTVVLKPSSDSPVTAYKFMEVIEEAGVPAGVVNLVTGRGGIIGDTLVGHPLTRFIAFTGSKEVGLHVNELASKTAEGQIWIKRVVAEMGGKDAIVVDKDTDLQEAATGTLASAFGFQGQKCSACSRVIVDKSVYNEFVDILAEKVKKFNVGNPADSNNYMGPVINEKAYKSILEYIEIGKKEGKLISGGKNENDNGYFINPTIIADIKPNDRLAQEEIFGPVLAVIKSNDFDDALKIANSTIYGLTGAVYTRDRNKIELAKRVFHCGNLYINRKCTGALVGVHPFGGFNMSGTDSKAGGRDYLLLFSQAKAISEKM